MAGHPLSPAGPPPAAPRAPTGLTRPSLTARLFLAVAALVGITALVAWILAGRVILRPFAEAVFAAYVDQAVFVAEELERGVPPAVLSERMHLDVSVDPRPPPPGPHWRIVEEAGREVWFRPGPRNVVYVESGPVWVTVHRSLDLERPGRRLAGLLLVGAGVIIGLAGWMARQATRPVQTATDAMARIAGGELGHRLEPTGPAELRTIAHAFNQMADRVDAMLRAEKQLMAAVSHELRTPLTRLRLQVALLADGAADPERLAAMDDDLTQLDALIGELLELSRLEIGHRTLERAPVDLGALAAEVIAATEAPDHVVEVSGEGAASVDRSLVRRALANLLANAVRYTPPGTTVRVVVDPHRIVVEDDGPGVPDAELGRLFEPFYRAEGSRSRDTGGLGLGLMIVRQIARLHGGTATAERGADGGLRIVLHLDGSAPPRPDVGGGDRPA